MGTFVRGLIAGAAGTTALNIVSYLDIAVRARPVSSTPERSVQRLADLAGVDLGEGRQTENRKAGLAALLGYTTGIGLGVAYALACRDRRMRWPASAVVLTAMAMVGSNGPLAVLGVSDPRTWSATDWVSDVIPHAVYGAVAASVYERVC